MPNETYLDYFCLKQGINRKFIHYLCPSNIDIILVVCDSDLKKKEKIDLLNSRSVRRREFTSSYLDSRMRDIRSMTFRLEYHAHLFGVSENIKQKTIEELREIVMNYYKETEDSECQINRTT